MIGKTKSENYTAIADKIREKTGGNQQYFPADMPSGIDTVYDSAYKDGQSSMVDPTKIIEKTASGIGSVSVDDVSEIPHEIAVKVSCKNLLDISNIDKKVSGVTVTTDGDYIKLSGTKLGATINKVKDMNFTLPIGTYTLSARVISGSYSNNAYSAFCGVSLNGSYNYNAYVDINTNKTFTLTEPLQVTTLSLIMPNDNVIYSDLVLAVQLEEGENVTDFVPYVTIEDFSIVTISRLNSNLFGGSAMADKMQELAPSVTREGNTVTYAAKDFHKKDLIDGFFKENTQYTIILKGTNSGSYSYLNLTLHYTDGTTREMYTTTGAFVTVANKTVQSIQGAWKQGNVTMICDECGIFEGNVLNREFEPYIVPTVYKPNADGTIEGVASLSPNMTLQSDIENVSISMSYHKSWGMHEEWDKFWDEYQERGNRTLYSSAFCGYCWNDNIFKPKYDLICIGSAASIFKFSPITDLAKILDDCGVVLDTSQATSLAECVSSSKITHLPVISTVGLTTLGNPFYGATELVTFDKLILKEDGSQAFSEKMFYNNNKLANIVIEGKFGCNVNMEWCPLTKASILSVVNSLIDTAEGKSLTLNLSAVNKAFETSSGAADGSTSEEWLNLVATKPNWTISLA